MQLSDLVQQIERVLPGEDPVRIAQLTNLLINSTEYEQVVENEKLFCELIFEMQLRLAASNDQLNGVSIDLHQLCQTDPREFNRDQIWVLLRAIKIQSQVLELFNSESSLSV